MRRADPHDPNTIAFLAIVNCRPDEVLEIPPGRRWSNKPKREPLFKGGMVLHFGKHKGKCLSEVPKDYLQWIVEQPASSEWFAESQEKIREWLR